jgi:hypothetical protein
MDLATYMGLRTLGVQKANLERCRIALSNQVHRLGEAGLPEAALTWAAEQIPALQLIEDRLTRQMVRQVKGTPLGDFVNDTLGLGPAVLLVAALLPPLTEMHSPAAVWRYCGLDVRGGRAPKMARGQMGGFSPRLRAFAIARVAIPIVKVTASPYRRLYDARKAATSVTHPDMLPQGGGCEHCDAAYGATAASRASRNLERERASVAFDCAKHGGVHWSPAHRHADALRVVAKAVLRDAWRVVRGLPPRLAGTEDIISSPAASAANAVAPDIGAPVRSGEGIRCGSTVTGASLLSSPTSTVPSSAVLPDSLVSFCDSSPASSAVTPQPPIRRVLARSGLESPHVSLDCSSPAAATVHPLSSVSRTSSLAGLESPSLASRTVAGV